MNSPEQFAAQTLEISAGAYAGYATGLLFDRHPDIADRFTASPTENWQHHLTQRMMELSAALLAAEPNLFVSRAVWTKRAFEARGVPTDDLVTSLECVAEVLAQNMPAEAARVTADYLDQALAALKDDTPATGGLNPDDPLDNLVLQYLMTILEGDTRRAIDRVLAAVDDGLDPQTAYLDVLMKAEREIGRMWHDAEATIAEEHLVTTTTQRAVALLTERAKPGEQNGKTVLAAGVSGNAHTMGIRAIADFFEMDGWRTIYLGPDVPAMDVVSAVQNFDADVLILSAALSVHLKAIRQTIQSVRQIENSDVKIMVGGSAFAEVPELWRRMAADGSAARADSAVAEARKLVGFTA